MTANTIAREIPAITTGRTTTAAAVSPLTYARIAGVLYLVIMIAAIVAHIYMPDTLIVPDDVAATAANIRESQTCSASAESAANWRVLSEIVLTLILYVLLKPVSATLSLIAAVARLIMTANSRHQPLNYFFVLLVLTDSTYTSAFDTNQQNALGVAVPRRAPLRLRDRHRHPDVARFPARLPDLQMGYIPRVLGVLFLLAGAGYLIDSMGILLVAGYETPGFIALPITVSEIAFPLWLLVKGVNVAQWSKRARAAA